MPRQPRFVIDGGIYHILTRGNNNQPVFHEEADYDHYLKLLATYARRHRLRVYHFALMPNHVHLVLGVSIAEALSKAMLGLNLTYAWFYRRRRRYSGHLWQGRFKSLLLHGDNYLLEGGRYVELAPVRAGVVTNPRDYPWSSYRVYAEGAASAIVTLNPRYDALGTESTERQQAYRRFILEGLAPQGTDPQFLPQDYLSGFREPTAIPRPSLPFPGIRRGRGRPRKLEAVTI